jgi:hypothetical protein
VFFCTIGFAKEAGKEQASKEPALQKIKTNDVYDYFLINNLLNPYSNNGDGSINPITGGSGLEYPKGSNKTAIFEDGLVWGGYSKGSLKVGGSVYRHALQAGNILIPGTPMTNPTAADPDDPLFTVYRVRPDINPNVPFSAVATKLQNDEANFIVRDDPSATAQSIYNRYISDWNNWPASLGAPFTYGLDSLGVQRTSGAYDPRYDIPGIKGADQTLWHVSNDMSAAITRNLAGSEPIGFEVQRTIWGYNQSGALGNTIFISYKVINYSGATVDSLLFTQWSDPDLGDATDDFTGCDLSRSLGYVYNGKGYDLIYESTPPASGFVFFAGPAVVGNSSDVAVIDLKYRSGYKNLKMSSFNFFINGDPLYTDPVQGTYVGTKQWYNLMNGLVGTTGGVINDPIAGAPTKFALSGDPVKGTGWLDGGIAPPGDRRMCLTTGPIYMNPMDTAEIVVALVVGQGADRISSVTELRSVTDIAQAAFNLLFDVPKPPPAPTVSVTPFDGGVVLNWSDTTQIRTIEADYTSKGYIFEGYRLQQFPRPVNLNGRTIKLFDVENPVLDNAGVQRYYATQQDELNSKSMVNGQSYYFGINSIAYNPVGVPPILEGSPAIFEAIPQPEVPGEKYSAQPLSTLPITQLNGSGSVSVTAQVIDPKQLQTGDFVIDIGADTVAGDINFKWDWNQGTTTLFGNQPFAPLSAGSPIFQGVQLAVAIGPQLIDSAYAYLDTSHINFDGSTSWFRGTFDDMYLSWSGLKGKGFDHTSFPVEIRFTGIADGSDPDYNDTTIIAGGQFGTYYEYPAWGKSYTDTTATGFKYKQIRFPFEVWDVVHNRQMGLMAASRNADAKAKWHTAKNALPYGYGNGFNPAYTGPYWYRMSGRDYFTIIDRPYTLGTADTAKINLVTDSLATFMFRFSGSWTNGDVFRFTFTQPPVPGVDRFGFHVDAETYGNRDLAREQVEKINVFPNPYFAFNKAEWTKYQRFVTFSHLPAKAVIRVYTIAGILVRTIVKDDPTQFVRWDLNNSYNLPVSSGMYIVHVDMPAIGKMKILKLAIIQPSQILDRL